MIPVLSFGPISLPVPELLIIFGIYIGIVLSEKLADKTGLPPKEISDLLFSMLVSGLIGARLSYLASDPLAFQGNFLSIFSLNTNFFEPNTGIVISLAVGYYLVSKKSLGLLSSLDALIPFLGILITFIRLSSFASGTNFGMQTSLPWGIQLWSQIRHPVNLYLALGSLIALGIGIWALTQSDLQPGCAFALFGLSTAVSSLVLTRYQAPTDLIGNSIRLNQILWLAAAILFYLIYLRLSPGVRDGSSK